MGEAPMAIMVPTETPVSLRAVKKENWNPTRPATLTRRAGMDVRRRKPRPPSRQAHQASRIIADMTMRAEPTVRGGVPGGASSWSVPVVPQHMLASRTSIIPCTRFLSVPMD